MITIKSYGSSHAPVRTSVREGLAPVVHLIGHPMRGHRQELLYPLVLVFELKREELHDGVDSTVFERRHQ